MRKQFFRILTLVALLFGMLTPGAQAQAAESSKGVSPNGMLNPDGSLDLDGGFNGTLDLKDWDVQLDPARGPLFLPIAAQNNWAAVGSGGGAFKDVIYAIAVVGTDVYVGGSFQDAGGNPEADYIAKWNGSQWTSLSNGGSGQGALSGNVRAILVSGGNLYVGGGFSTRDTSGFAIANANNLSMWNGSVWSAVPGITTNLSSTVNGLAIDSANNILYFAGGFTNVNGNTEADRIAGIDLDVSSLVVLGNNGAGEGSLNNEAYAVAVDSAGNVYAGGFFSNVNNGVTSIPEADFVARWDGANWSAMGGSGNGALGAMVTALAIDASENVYVGGWFFNAAGIAEADYIAKWNGSNWSALGSNGSGDGALLGTGGGSTIQEIVVNGTDVYVGGFFIGSSGIPTADYAARFDTNTNTWSGLGSNGSGNGSLNHGATGMAFSGGNLYVGGSMHDVNNGGTVLPTADYFTYWNGANWSTLGESNGALNYQVDSMAVIGTDVYVGGNFVNLGGEPRMDYLVRWDGAAWNPVGNLNQTFGSLNGRVRALAVDGTDLYAGGDFTNAYNEGVVVTVNRVAKWSGSTWSTLGNGVNASVYALAVDSSHNVYVGGGFFDADSIPEADYIAMWNGSAWSALSSNGASNGALSSAVHTIAINGADVYVGGQFTSVVDTTNTTIPNAGRLAKWNGLVWSAMDGITSPLSSQVNALTFSGGNLYIGGTFTDLNGISAADYIARWNGSAWSALGSNNIGDGSIAGSVEAIVVDGTKVYAAGVFTNVNNGAAVLSSADYIAMWDGVNWFALGSNGSNNGSLNGYVETMMIVNSDLWVGGNFQNVNNNGPVIKEADFLAVFGVDTSVPVVSSIMRADPDPTGASSVDFTVVFSEEVTGVDTGDFTLVTAGVTNATMTGISGSGDTYTLAVNTGTGDGTIRLDLIDDDSILDVTFNPLGGAGAVNGDFNGETYNVVKIAPSLIAPANSSVLNYNRPVFDWSDFPGAGSYQIQASKSNTFSRTVLNKTSIVSTYTAMTSLPPNALLFWRVRAKVGAAYGAWSEVWSFTTANPPSVPSLQAPANGGKVSGPSPLFNWKDSTIPAGETFDHYQIQVASDLAFSAIIHDADIAGLTNSQNNTAILNPGTIYYWRVRAFNTDGDYSAWSTLRSVKIKWDPPAPLTPADTSAVGSLLPTFTWTATVGATSYTIHVSTANTFNPKAISKTIPAASYTATTSLKPATTYFWRVRVNGLFGPSEWSTTFSFTTP